MWAVLLGPSNASLVGCGVVLTMNCLVSSTINATKSVLHCSGILVVQGKHLLYTINKSGVKRPQNANDNLYTPAASACDTCIQTTYAHTPCITHTHHTSHTHTPYINTLHIAHQHIHTTTCITHIIVLFRFIILTTMATPPHHQSLAPGVRTYYCEQNSCKCFGQCRSVITACAEMRCLATHMMVGGAKSLSQECL